MENTVNINKANAKRERALLVKKLLEQKLANKIDANTLAQLASLPGIFHEAVKPGKGAGGTPVIFNEVYIPRASALAWYLGVRPDRIMLTVRRGRLLRGCPVRRATPEEIAAGRALPLNQRRA